MRGGEEEEASDDDDHGEEENANDDDEQGLGRFVARSTIENIVEIEGCRYEGPKYLVRYNDHRRGESLTPPFLFYLIIASVIPYLLFVFTMFFRSDTWLPCRDVYEHYPDKVYDFLQNQYNITREQIEESKQNPAKSAEYHFKPAIDTSPWRLSLRK